MKTSRNQRDQLVQAIQSLHQRGWCDGTGGNFSVVLQHQPLRLLMAPSGVDKGQVNADQLIVVDQTCNVLTGEGNASAETALHLRIVDATKAGAVLHTHSVPGTVLSHHYENDGVITLDGWEMLKGLHGINTHATSIKIPVISNSQSMQALSDAIAPSLASAPCGFLVAGHGLYAWGESLESSKRHIEILEFLLNVKLTQMMIRTQS
ncbi:methylthioribulose 1-phosphate dehydratase [Synechococcus sp. HB1133]|uniref:methylthioribulose 1-phosphate dehydratase n=1 Tax=unclassified Synechococcus TaxID=2626047 RepID=UPI001CF804C0